MPQTVTHFLVPVIILVIFRQWYLKNHKGSKFPLQYVLIGGLAGIIPDLDIAVFWVLKLVGSSVEFNSFHRAILHTLFVPIVFLCIGFATKAIETQPVGRNWLKWSTIWFVVAFGSFMHLVLDALLSKYIVPFYPFSSWQLGTGFPSQLPAPLNELFLPTLDGALFILWLLYMEFRHKITDLL